MTGVQTCALPISATAGRFPHVSGLTVEFDPARPAGSRILSIKVGGAALDPNRIYRTATNDFLARGGDGYAMFANLKPLVPVDDTPQLATEVMIYLSQIGTVRSGSAGRVVAK